MTNQPEKLVYIVSLGCPKNFVDTEVMAAALLQANIGITPYLEEADIYMINTCAFIPDARNEASDTIKDALDWKAEAPEFLSVVVTGCLNQWDVDGIYKEQFPEVDLWLGISEVENVPEHMSNMLGGGLKEKMIRTKRPKYLYDHNTPRIQLTAPHYAYLKIAEGCDHNCSYCSIPRIRGKLRSRTLDSAVKEAQAFINNGVKEIIIIAQDTTFFGDDSDDPNVSLTGLIKEIDKIPGDYWIRVLYTHPASFPDELIEVFNTSKHLLPYLDMPLQHISDNILECMGRKITTKETVDLLHKIKKEVPKMCFRTTFIIGYPGETEENFQEIYDLCKEFEFDRMGAFTYSAEPYTRAASLDNQVDHKVAQERCDKLMQLQQEISLSKNEAMVGREFDVLVDVTAEDGSGVGRSYMDAPDIDNSIIIRNDGSVMPGDKVKVKITGYSEYDLEGQLV